MWVVGRLLSCTQCPDQSKDITEPEIPEQAMDKSIGNVATCEFSRIRKQLNEEIIATVIKKQRMIRRTSRKYATALEK